MIVSKAFSFFVLCCVLQYYFSYRQICDHLMKIRYVNARFGGANHDSYTFIYLERFMNLWIFLNL